MAQRPQHEIEVILMRQVASYLATPIFIVDPLGDLVYFNEKAETLLGHRYDETGEMARDEWSTMFTPTDEDGIPLSPDDLPLGIALAEKRAAFAPMWITGLDGVRRNISVMAFPLVGQHDRDLGAVAVFWENDRS